jgi:DNA-binding transcriptional MerR regulator
MPSLQSYVPLAPFGLEELVEAANSILRDRPRLKLTTRTTRYYISEGILPPPSGSPKFARYGIDHLARLVSARCLQDQGMSLQEVRVTLDSMTDPLEEAQHLVEQRVQVQESRIVAEMSPSYASRPRRQTSFVRIPLTPRISIEVKEEAMDEQELRRALKELQRIIDERDFEELNTY